MGIYMDRVKEYFTFKGDDLKNVMIGILVVSFIFGFDDGTETFNVAIWMLNFVKVFLIVAMASFAHESCHKLVALIASYRSEYRLWPYGIVIGIILTLVTNGSWYVLIPGGIITNHIAIQRLGTFRYGLSSFLQTWITFAGPAANVIIALIFKLLLLSTGLPIFALIVKINLWYAVWNVLPIPPLDGSLGFMGGRGLYMWLTGFVFGAAIMISLARTFLTIFMGTIILSIIFWWMYYLLIERTAM